MNRTEYIDQLQNRNFLKNSDYVIINSLIYALTPDEACKYLDLTFKQNHYIRLNLLKKISKDIAKSYTSEHKKLIASLIKKLNEKNFRKKECCSCALDKLRSNLPSRVKVRILKIFLESKSRYIRSLAFRQLKYNWNNKYYQIIEQLWHSFHDNYCLRIILDHFPITFLLDNYKTILQHTLHYQQPKLFIKVGKINPELLTDLKEIDEISYCYVMAKLGMRISDIEAKEILDNNYQKYGINFLLWSFGQMGLWDIIIEYQNKYNYNEIREKFEKYFHK
ncbi:MAG: hypothetical protein KA792_10435 [Bacteroidales bacterium]|nr:hypothetical protein [Bacteroidales bacterium]